jgi:hypothetical protein
MPDPARRPHLAERIERSIGRARLQVEADRSSAVRWMGIRPWGEPGELCAEAARFEQTEVVRVAAGPQACALARPTRETAS